MALRTNKTGWIIAGFLLSILMASMDNTILATSMGTIVGDLGGMHQFVWVISAYMIAEMAGMPIFGKLSDMYGRKRFFIFGILMFIIGSALCGTADSITELSAAPLRTILNCLSTSRFCPPESCFRMSIRVPPNLFLKIKKQPFIPKRDERLSRGTTLIKEAS